MTKTKIDLLTTNVVNVLLLVGIFAFGYIRWQKLQGVIVESNASQEQYRYIHDAMKSTIQLGHLGEKVYEWTTTDSVAYQRKLAETNGVLDSLRAYYPHGKIDSIQVNLNEKGRILSRIYETVIKRNENDEHLREDRQVTVRDTETFTKHYTGNITRKSREETSSRSKTRTVTVPSINELAFVDKTLYDINLSLLSDSLAEVNQWLDVNMGQMLDTEDTKAEKQQAEMLEKASGIGQHTFMGGMALLLIAAFLNVANSWRRARTMKKLEKESEKNKSLYKSRRDMMYMVTHELKTPLSPVVGYSSLMQQTAQLDATNKGYLDKICESAGKMKLLIESLLEYFAIESAKTDIAKKPFNMRNVAEMMTATFSLEARQKGLEYNANDCENLALMGDEGKLIQIGSNLLANAVKFTDNGSVGFFIGWAEGVLTMEVTDTGIGIDSDEQQKIFEPFKQLGKAKALGKDGIGLGLSIVWQLVRLMNGNIELQSEVGKGSKFTVTIPIEKMTEDNFGESGKNTTEDDGVRRVLAIDDTESCLDMMRDILKENGVECDTCTKAKDMVERMRQKDYDLLVIDLKMPEINGIELAKTLRESEVGNSQSVKMVISTAWSDDHDAQELLSKGFDGILSKPFNTQDLMNMVNTLVPKGRKREVPDLSSVSLRMLPKLIREVEDGITALWDGVEKKDMEMIDDWCHRLAGTWGLIHADEPLDELHELLKNPTDIDEKALRLVIGKVETMGSAIVRKSKERINSLENE